jgi:hypothetical protein
VIDEVKHEITSDDATYYYMASASNTVNQVYIEKKADTTNLMGTAFIYNLNADGMFELSNTIELEDDLSIM